MSNQPYIGLRPFERDETDIFFGREQHTDELIDRLGASHFLAVVGTSGCGKSSLVKTGLIAGLDAGYLASTGTHWRIVEMRPSNQPFQALADKLFSELNDILASDYTADTLQQTLRQGSLSLHELLGKYPLPNNAQLLIVCDQFEEIFRYFKKEETTAEARNFVSLLLASSQPYPLSTTQLSHSIYVVITMRSDFLGECAQFAGLAEAINQGLYLTPRLNAQQLRAAIEEPTFVFGREIEPALVMQLLEDAQNNQDQLPLLQHLLMRLWDLASDKTATLTLTDYEAIGGLTNALSRHADEVYDQLTKEQQRIAELLFRSLTERGDAQSDTRRPTQLTDIVELTASSFTEVVAVIDMFRQTGCCFLMPPINVALTVDSIIDISHESLIRQWQRLKNWAVDEAESSKIYQRLEDRVIQCQKEKAGLLRSPELEIYQQWWQEKSPNALWAKRYGELRHEELISFIEKSIVQKEVETAEKERMRRIAEQQKELALEVINAFTYGIPEALANIPSLTASILEYNIQSLEKIYTLNQADNSTQRERSVNFSKAGDVYLQLGDTQKALEHYSQGLKISEQLAKKDPQNSQAQQDLSVSFERLADVYLRLGDTQKALEYYSQVLTQSLKVRENIATQEPQNSQAQRDWSVSFIKLADVYLRLGDAHKALDNYSQGLKISEQLVAQDPKNSEAQRDLFANYTKLATLYQTTKENQTVLKYLKLALPIAEKLAEDKLNLQAQQDLKQVQTKLADLAKK